MILSKGFSSYARYAALLGLLLALLGPACAKKGPVRPKLQSLPAAPEELTLDQRGATLQLGWTIPDRNQDGGRADALVGFHVLRQSSVAEQGCPDCREPADLLARISVAYPAPAQRIGNRFYWRDAQVEPGASYRYRVVPQTTGGQSGLGADIQRVMVAPPPVPTGLTGRLEGRRVHLQWLAPITGAGVELLGYNLYRRQGEAAFPPVPLNPQPVPSTWLIDEGLAGSQGWEYRISALVKVADTLVESALSQGVRVDLPED